MCCVLSGRGASMMIEICVNLVNGVYYPRLNRIAIGTDYRNHSLKIQCTLFIETGYTRHIVHADQINAITTKFNIETGQAPTVVVVAAAAAASTVLFHLYHFPSFSLPLSLSLP